MRIGISWRGIIVFLLPMIINIIYFIFPPVNATEGPDKVNKIVEGIEQITRIMYMIAICFLVSKKEVSFNSVWFYVGMAFLVLYYVVWIRYFVAGRDVAFLSKSFCFIPMPLAVFPVLYFLCAAMWLHNVPAFVIMVIFGVAHNIVSYSSL